MSRVECHANNLGEIARGGGGGGGGISWSAQLECTLFLPKGTAGHSMGTISADSVHCHMLHVTCMTMCMLSLIG